MAYIYSKYGFRHYGRHRVPDPDKEIQTRGFQRSAKKRKVHFVYGWMPESVRVGVPDYFQFLCIFPVGACKIIRDTVLRLHRHQSCVLVSLPGRGVLRYHFRKHLRRRLIPTKPYNALKASDAENAVKVNLGG